MLSHLQSLLSVHAAAWPDQRDLAARFRAFVDAHPDCLHRHCQPGHITASAWIVSADGQRCLLTHHRKLGRWLQLGGHVDGEERIELAALREAREESGIVQFELVRWREALVPLDLDVHPIPARGNEPGHWHWDVRFLLRAAADEPLVQSSESNDLRWFGMGELAAVTDEDSVRRLAEKAALLRGRSA
jgi:8-oxo-dGTP pyrophosphatase MutT (NUDIX family)